MRSLWIRIGLGALGIFAVGMMVLTLIAEARHRVKEAILGALGSAEQTATDPHPANASLSSGDLVEGIEKMVASATRAGRPHGWGREKSLVDLPFVLDGRAIGTIGRFQIRRVHAGEVPDLILLVALENGVSDLSLSDCDLRPADDEKLDLDRGFTCARGAEADLVTLGEVRFEPLGVSRPLLVSRRAAQGMAHGDPFQATADIGGEVKVTARGRDGEGVRVDAGDGHATVRVNDSLGRALVRLLADSSGAFLRVRGKDGRDLVRMDAGKGGFSLTVDTTASDQN